MALAPSTDNYNPLLNCCDNIVDRVAPEKCDLRHSPLYFFFPENITMRGNKMIYKDLPSAEILRSVFTYDEISGKLYWKKKVANCVKIGTEAGFISGKGRLQVTYQNKFYYVSRIIWKMMTGSIPNDKQIDHEDRNPLNNAWNNLKLKTQSENKKNCSLQKNNTSGIVGVCFHEFSGLWYAKISNNGNFEYKYFKEKEDAIKWRKEKERFYGYHKNHGKKVSSIK